MTLAPGGSSEPPPIPLTAFQSRVVDLVGDLRRGEVVTYAEVAAEIGRPGSGQAVANVLRRVPDLPWWRVIPSTGRLYRTHAPTQAPLLRAEGVSVDAHLRVATHMEDTET
jgi:methylated-DNA-protein-cysteine methyltransferase related protein